VQLLVFIWSVLWPTQLLPCTYLQRLNNTKQILFTLPLTNKILTKVIRKVQQNPKVICHTRFSTTWFSCYQILLSLTARFVCILLKIIENNVHLNAEALNVLWMLYVPQDSISTNSTFCSDAVFMCFVWISKQTAIISLYSINWLVL
jgi:hypothetical protein